MENNKFDCLMVVVVDRGVDVVVRRKAALLFEKFEEC